MPPLMASPACDVLARLARAHFRVATVLITLSDSQGQCLLAADGTLPDALPPDLFASSLQMGTGLDTIVVLDTLTDQRFCIDWQGVPVRLPRFLAACALGDASGNYLGALYLLDDVFLTLDELGRAFLRDLAVLAAQALVRAQEETALCNRIAELEAAQELATLAMTGSGTGIWDRNVVTGEIHYSSAWKAILGYEPHELSNQVEDAYLRLHPDDLEHVKATMQAHFESRTDSYSVEHRIRCKDGTYKWICSRGKVVSRDLDGRARRMVGTTTDITAAREIATQLQKSVGLITNLTDQVPGLVFQYEESLDGRGFFSYASDGIRDIYELMPEQVAHSSHPVEARIDPRDLAMYRQSLLESATKLTPWHLEYRVRLPRQGLQWRQGDARPRRLPDGSTLWHGFIMDLTERKRIEAELHELATIDHLTQLPNRRHFMNQSEAELVRVQRRESQDAAVLMFDLDHFKAINDRWGHALGDLALIHFAKLLCLEVRPADIVGRLGGEEFAVVLPSTDIEAAVAFGQRVQRRATETPLIDGDNRVAIAVSIGIDNMRVTDVGAYQALARADKALYLAKEWGRNRIEIYHE